MSAARVRELDGIRALAILLVLVWHYLVCQIFPAEGTWAFALKRALGATWSGVDLFFVLSGFLIGGILIDNRRAGAVLSAFFVRRACRIFPLYLFVVGAFLAIAACGLQYSSWLFENPFPYWSYLTLTQNFAAAARDAFGPHWLGVSWSLAVEEQFYLVIPFLLVLAPRPLALAALALLVCAAPFLRASEGLLDSYVLPFSRADSLLLGVLCAYLVRSGVWRDRQRFWRVSLSALLAGLAAAFAWQTWQSPRIGGAVNHLVFALFYANLILWAQAWRGAWPSAPLRSGILGWIARRSYAIYLLHQLVSGSVHQAVLGGAPAISDVKSALTTIAALVVTFVLAEASFHLVERPFQKWGAKWSYASRSAPAPLPA